MNALHRFSSAFKTIIPSKLITKLHKLGINTSLCHWILGFLTSRKFSISSTLTLNTGVPQGCVLSPLLYSLFPQDHTSVHCSNTSITFTDDTKMVGLVNNNDGSSYREKVQHLAARCAGNHLALIAKKTKQLIVDFRKTKGGTHPPIAINGTKVEHIASF